ncbi:hypothetical protein [Nostoc sp. 106C]|nr:hypothetical protein [Nostoc sp. 106C]
MTKAQSRATALRGFPRQFLPFGNASSEQVGKAAQRTASPL